MRVNETTKGTVINERILCANLFVVISSFRVPIFKKILLESTRYYWWSSALSQVVLEAAIERINDDYGTAKSFGCKQGAASCSYYPLRKRQVRDSLRSHVASQSQVLTISGLDRTCSIENLGTRGIGTWTKAISNFIMCIDVSSCIIMCIAVDVSTISNH